MTCWFVDWASDVSLLHAHPGSGHLCAYCLLSTYLYNYNWIKFRIDSILIGSWVLIHSVNLCCYLDHLHLMWLLKYEDLNLPFYCFLFLIPLFPFSCFLVSFLNLFWGLSWFQWLWLCAPNAGGQALIPGQGTRFHILQLSVHTLN